MQEVWNASTGTTIDYYYYFFFLPHRRKHPRFVSTRVTRLHFFFFFFALFLSFKLIWCEVVLRRCQNGNQLMTSNDIRRALSTWTALTRFHSLPAASVVAPVSLHLAVSSIFCCPLCPLFSQPPSDHHHLRQSPAPRIPSLPSRHPLSARNGFSFQSFRWRSCSFGS